MRIPITHLFALSFTILTLNSCCSVHRISSNIRFATDDCEKYSTEYCTKLFEDYGTYKKLYRNYDDVMYLFHYLDLLDSAREYCNDVEKICSYEYDLLMTLGLYQECVHRVQNFPDSIFEYPYDKTFMLNSAQSAIDQINNDTVARNQHNFEIIKAIYDYWIVKYETEQTINNNIVNYKDLAKRFHEDDTMRVSKTLLVYYIVRARFEDIEKLQNEISDFTIKNEIDSIFICNLQHSIQQMKKRKNYHFERDIIINPPTDYHISQKERLY